MKYSSFVFGMLGKDQPAAQDNGGESSGARNIPGNGNSSNSNSSGPNIGTVTSNNGGMASGDPAAEFQAEFVCKQRFADNFWSLDERCISVLMHKLKNAKQTSCDILQMVSTRATMEDDLGKKLAKLSRAGLGTEEVGSIKDALRTVRAEMESNAKCHLELARQLRTEIEKPLSSFINDQRAKRRAQTSIIQKTEGDRNSLRSQLRKLQDKRRGDTKKVGDLDLQVNGLQGVGDPKLRTKLDRAQMQQKATENEYVDVRERLKDADQQWYNVWRSACDVFQVLEEERIEYLKTCLWTFTNLISSSCVADDESMERIRQDLEKISVADDIAEFIQTFGTGAPDPELALGQPAAGGDTDRGRGRGRGGDRGRGGGGGGHNYNHSNGQQPQHNSSDSDDAGNADNALNSGAQMHRPTPSTGGQGSAIPAPAPAPVTSSPVSSFSPGTAMTPEHPAYPKRSSTPNSISNSNNTFPSIGTSGTARSGSILAPSMSSRPQTQESIRQQHQQQQRPVSMHAAAAGNPPISGSPALHGQAQHLFNANSNWNSRPVSSMQGSIGANSNFRRASNNDMYAMGAGNHQQQPQPQSQQQQQPSHQFVQRTNSQVAMRPGDVPPGGYIGAGNSGVYMGAMDPRAPSNVGMYRGANAEPSLPITNTAQQQQRPGTPSQQPMGDMNSGYAMNSFAQQAQLQQPPRLDSPRSRANTYNGPQHTGNFGTLTGNTQMHPSPQQAFVGPAVGGVNGGMGPHSQPNSAPSSPYQQAMGANNRPMSSAGMHNGQVPGQMMQAPAMQYGAMGMPPNAGPPQPVYRSATPVQQSPQYVSNMMSRPPTQMSHSPVSRVHPQQMGSAVPSPQMNQRVPSVMSGNYQHPHHTQQQQQQQQHAAPAATNSSAVAGANQLSESGKEILFYVKVLYDYDADNNKELTIREGDVISVLAVSADGWWDGEMTDRRTGRAIQGTFPSNFTDPISH